MGVRLFATSPHVGCGRRSVTQIRAQSQYEIRICTNKVCKRQGSEQLVKFGQDLALPGVEVVSCGCLGNCGKGPNLVVLPKEVVLNHVSTPADLAEVVRWQCEVDVPDAALKATQLRLAGNQLIQEKDYEGAVASYTQGLAVLEEAGCLQGRHLLYSNRSAAQLTLGRADAALQDAQAAVQYGPSGWQTASLRLIDAYYVLQRYKEAAQALEQISRGNRTFRNTREYKAIAQALQRQGLKVAA